MSASIHPALPARRRQWAYSWRTPLTVGIAYGLYLAWVMSNNNASGTRIAVVSIVGGAIVVVLSFLIGLFQARMSPELQALSYAVVFGTAMGYLISQSTSDPGKSAALGGFLGIGMGIVVFYIRRTHER
jgi:hypothetical protein